MKLSPWNVTRTNSRRPRFEQLEVRSMLAADANLVAFRPVNQYIDYTKHAVPDAVEMDVQQGPGIRVNWDDDDRNGQADYRDLSPSTTSDNDLVRVDALGTGSSFVISWTGNLSVWTSPTKATPVGNGGVVAEDQSLWVEYTSQTHTLGAEATLTLTVGDAGGGASAIDSVVFHSFRSIVALIGGNTQEPSNFGDPNLGIYNIGGALYDSGYDAHLYAHGDVQSNGQGAAYNEIVSAVIDRNADKVAILGYSWGGGATYELSVGLAGNPQLAAAGYRLEFTAYIDGIRHRSIGAERRLPVGTNYHDNYFQRKDLFIKGDTVSGANNVNVTKTSWGRRLSHTTIDDHATVQGEIIAHLKLRVSR